MTAQFDYEQAAPIDLLASEPESVEGIAVRSITYASPRGGRANALLFTPPGAGPFPAVVMMPGSNQPPASFRPTALEVARRGAIVLVADQSQTRPGHTALYSFTAAERDEFVQTVVDVRRGVDVLAARADVDPKRVAFWGFSHGAFIGGILAGVERRIGSYVLQSGGGADYLRTTAPQRLRDPGALDAYLATIASMDPDLYVAHAAPSAVLLQNGSLDKTYSAGGVAAWQAAASEPKKITTYQTDHGLDATATADALAWLASRIGTIAATTIADARGTLAQGTIERRPAGPLYVSVVETDIGQTGAIAEQREPGFELVLSGSERITAGTTPPTTLGGGRALFLKGDAATRVESDGRALSYFVSLRPAAARSRIFAAGRRPLYESADLPTAATPAGMYRDELVLLVLQPGAAAPPHMHGGVEPTYVIEGTIELRVAGRPVQRLGPGDGETVLPDTPLLITNVGSTVARVLVMLATPEGRPVQSSASPP